MSHRLIAVSLAFTFATLSLPASAADDCCSIVSVDRASGRVNAQEIASRRAFEFEVDSLALLRQLQVGDSIRVKIGAGGKFSVGTADEVTRGNVYWIEECCVMVSREALAWLEDCCNATGVAVARNLTAARQAPAKVQGTPKLELAPGVMLELTRAQGSRGSQSGFLPACNDSALLAT